jgi:hypothetical protein
MNRSQTFSWVLVGLACCGSATAADALPPSLRACMQETDVLRRLACFDRESALLAGQSAPVARQVDPAPARPAAPAPAAPVASAAATAGAAAATAQSAEDKFGYRGNIARADIDKKKEAELQESEQLTAKVTAVSALPNGGMALTLDNGQVWQQKTADRGMRVKVGDQVTIKRGVLNSFLLTSDTNKGSMRVARVK